MELRYFEFLKHLIRFNRQVYLDHNATTPVSDHVRRKMEQVLRNQYGNPSSFYGIGRKSAELLEEARQHVAKAIHADPSDVYFTACATESNNAALKSVAAHFYPKKKKIVSTPIEHPSVLKTLDYLETQGVIVKYCPVDDKGRVQLVELEKMIDEDTFLVCCMLANNETGVIQDIKAVTKIAHQHGALVLTDCVQALGKIPIDLHSWDVDYASFSAHKLYGPKGIGALYIKQGSPFTPLLHGGHQESGLRAGTESLHNIVGFGAACQDVDKLLAQSKRTQTLKRQLTQRLKEIKPDCVINSPESESLPNTLSVTFPGVENAGLMGMLDYRGIAVSAGSACSTGEDTPSHVLKAIGVSDQAARETIRISLGHETSSRDIRYATQVIQDYIEGRISFVNMLAPAQLNENILFDEKTFILDVRPGDDRKKFEGLPNSHQVNPLRVENYLKQLPRDKNILVYCPGGGLSVMISYYLKSKGFKKITNLRGGLDGWRKRRSDLYEKYAGQNVTILEPDKVN
ncbi:MAG: aminotransferase class V-fold PLP-dependent enzyme [Anaerolineae bacterium]|nr:aminotransferase class V-fold PLP-dependent enzyme [Anaerolineae bacterium]MBL8103997.1 aminotransferase class V-fold PLP-dependent enzyme [Anaerolineales bacterium]MCC7190762.1 aminotransferase class V-fold PLP-dependent enzyme [Anaerolineales bacterium]